MNKFKWVGCGLLVACLVVGCAKSDDDVMKEQIAIMNELSAELEKVDSKEAAEKAKGKFEALSKRMDENEKVIKGWPEAKQKEMKKKYEKEGGEAALKMLGSMMKASTKAGGDIPGLKKPQWPSSSAIRGVPKSGGRYRRQRKDPDSSCLSAGGVTSALYSSTRRMDLMMTSCSGTSRWVRTTRILSTTSMPSMTLPKTQ